MSPAAPRLPSGSGSDQLKVDWGVLSPELPRAQEGDKRGTPAAGNRLGSAGVVGRNADPGIGGASTPVLPQERPQRARPSAVHRSAGRRCCRPTRPGIRKPPHRADDRPVSETAPPANATAMLPGLADLWRMPHGRRKSISLSRDLRGGQCSITNDYRTQSAKQGCARELVGPACPLTLISAPGHMQCGHE